MLRLTGHRKAEREKGCQLYAAEPLAERGVSAGITDVHVHRPCDG
jgi:hypothetical protein